MTIVVGSQHKDVAYLREYGVTVLFEPMVPKEVLARHKEIQDYSRKNLNLINLWDVSVTNIERMFQQ